MLSAWRRSPVPLPEQVHPHPPTAALLSPPASRGGDGTRQHLDKVGELFEKFVTNIASSVTKCLDILCIVPPIPAPLALTAASASEENDEASASEENDEASASEENDKEHLLSAASDSIAESKLAAAASAAGDGSGGRGNGDGHLCDLNEWAVERHAAAQARLGAGNPDARRQHNPG